MGRTEFQITRRTIAQKCFQYGFVRRLRFYALRVETECLAVSLALIVVVTLFLEVLSDLYRIVDLKVAMIGQACLTYHLGCPRTQGSAMLL